MNANIMKTEFFHTYHFYLVENFRDFFNLGVSNLITTSTYVLMDNFCPCFLNVSSSYLTKELRDYVTPGLRDAVTPGFFYEF